MSGQTTNKVRARERFPDGPDWRPGYRVVGFPMNAGHRFELRMKCHRQLPELDLAPAARWVEVMAAEPIQRWEVGVVLLSIRGKVWQVRICASGECVLLREHKTQAAGKGGG